LHTLSISSVAHWILAYYLAVKLDWKMDGISIATFIHFVIRFLISMGFANWQPDLKKGLVPFLDKSTIEDLEFVARQGLYSIMLRVMSWWTFDIYMCFSMLLK
jgi:hypothetical protein